jgi:hypothetical protein
MAVILNPRGIGGSGKTELVRRIMAEYGWAGGGAARSRGRVMPLCRDGRKHPIGYRLLHPFDHRPLLVFGHYERSSGGCDTIRLSDGGLAEIFRLAADQASRGHDVLLEGLQLSRETDGTAELARLYPLHVLHLDTPPAASARNLVRRRRAGAAKLPLIVSRAIAERDSVAAACERLQAHAQVHRLSFEGSLAKARELLCLI